MAHRPNVSTIVVMGLGITLLAAGLLKGQQLLTEPVAGDSVWTYRPFLILQVEFELALGIWLLSGLFRKAAWLAALSCFCLFSVVTLVKALAGADSCGCFGSVHVNPWITLLAIDLPAVVALSVFRPNPVWPPRLLLRIRRRRRPLKALIREFVGPLPSTGCLAVTAGLILAVLGTSTPILALNEPAAVTSTYEILEPKTWVGKELPILDEIDIADQFKQGTWLLLLYHHDCPDCRRAIPQYQQMARGMAGNEDSLRIALIEVPPYGPTAPGDHSPCALGRLSDVKEWFVTTPAVALLTDVTVRAAWERAAPDFETVVSKLTDAQSSTADHERARERL